MRLLSKQALTVRRSLLGRLSLCCLLSGGLGKEQAKCFQGKLATNLDHSALTVFELQPWGVRRSRTLNFDTLKLFQSFQIKS